MIRLSALEESRIAPPLGGEPIPRCVPPPRTSTFNLSRSANASTAATSCSVSGMTTTRGITPATQSASVAGVTLPCISALRACCSDREELLITAPALEPLSHTRNFQRMETIGAGLLSAETRGWVHLVGVAEVVGIEGTTDELMGRQICLAEHNRHVCLLVNAHAVFARDAAP